MRTCADQPLNDCAVANDVIYCYCKDDLCNSKKAKLIREQLKQKKKVEATQHVKTPPPTDDEDLEESSGMGEITYGTEQRKKQIASPVDTSSMTNKFQLTLKPVTEALNITTPSPATNLSGASTTINTCSITNKILLILTILTFSTNFLRINY